MSMLSAEDKQATENTQGWPLQRVGLRVLNMTSSLDYYTRLGFSIVRDEREQDGTVGLGVGGQEILQLRQLENGRRRPARTAGLYHFAILLPNEVALGSFLLHILQNGIALDGASDHLVSQALYLSDPEGNGIEVYADRPRAGWQWKNGNIAMATLRLDADELLKKAEPFNGFPAQTVLGHMHLNVGDLERSEAFYQKLGMELTAGFPGQASFLSWDNYHHHLGINLWAGRNVARQEPDVSGVDFFEISRSTLSPATFQDADGVTVIVTEHK